ncbi:hypothetical protein OG893_26800 [Streptomyces sp. NBC_01696]|uniref:hypothetical protein n=2 Tax=unclassified Streptomyces TaxID=2593676 RepID=UPI002E33FD15|nr:hypothetical protein [Streptomyces sp. NBC_01696]
MERFITAMERSNAGAATHPQVFLRVKGILKDAHRRGINGLDPLLDVSPPEYRPGPTVIPTKEQVGLLRAARDDDSFRLIVDLMAGMGLRNGEALAVNVNNVVAKDVYRVHQQVHDRTVTLEPLKHRKTGEFRPVERGVARLKSWRIFRKAPGAARIECRRSLREGSPTRLRPLFDALLQRGPDRRQVRAEGVWPNRGRQPPPPPPLVWSGPRSYSRLWFAPDPQCS